MKKFLIIGILSLALVELTGCEKNNNVINCSVDASVNSYGTYEWISPDGVHYWVYSGAYRYGIAPKYNSKGELVIDKED